MVRCPFKAALCNAVYEKSLSRALTADKDIAVPRPPYLPSLSSLHIPL